MAPAAVVAFLCGLAAVAFLGAVGVRARRLSGRATRLGADALEPVSGDPPLAEARATHLRTLVGVEDACLAGFPAGLAGVLRVTSREVVLAAAASLHVPLARLVEAAFVPAFEGRASSEGVLLRLTWERGGERLESVFLVGGRRVDAERLRKEIHLRAGRAPPPPRPDGVGPPAP